MPPMGPLLRGRPLWAATPYSIESGLLPAAGPSPMVSSPDHRAHRTDQRGFEQRPRVAAAIERWFRLEWMEHTPFYLGGPAQRRLQARASGDNLCPGGFNKPDPEMLPLAVQARDGGDRKICPGEEPCCWSPQRRTRHAQPDEPGRMVEIFARLG